jgi:hypothetical protein
MQGSYEFWRQSYQQELSSRGQQNLDAAGLRELAQSGQFPPHQTSVSGLLYQQETQAEEFPDHIHLPLFTQHYQIRQTYYFDVDRFGFGIHFEEQTTKQYRNRPSMIFTNADQHILRSQEANVRAHMVANNEIAKRHSIKDPWDPQGSNFS